MNRCAVGLVIATSACHVTTQTETTRPGAIARATLTEGAIARRPALVLTDTGMLRFVEPLECPTEELVTTVNTLEIATRPNLATFVVGVIAATVGGVMTVRGATADDARNPTTYAGITALVVGVPLAIGPWMGTRVELRPGAETAPVRRAGPRAPCGERPLRARAATLTMRGIEVRGGIDAEGQFAISPYQLVDAYAASAIPAWDVTAHVEAEGGASTVTSVLEAGALAARAPAFLARADFDVDDRADAARPRHQRGHARASAWPRRPPAPCCGSCCRSRTRAPARPGRCAGRSRRPPGPSMAGCSTSGTSRRGPRSRASC